jgi:hypothetical protein
MLEEIYEQQSMKGGFRIEKHHGLGTVERGSGKAVFPQIENHAIRP